ncbi:nuclear transport factor 2 family protein [Sphingobium lactosutens]|mgnify:CR=1 FL=1|uniref:nuclear transport factor 2 family protein n=1 Tax=Sphingobium lactosutens TaxID=522773 RepID=UPI0015BAE6BD|nr:nuclear transport factor 2 family protein [Sphingobium lactosutens]
MLQEDGDALWLAGPGNRSSAGVMNAAEEALIIRLATELDDAVDRKDWVRFRRFFAETVGVDIGSVTGSEVVEMDVAAFVAEVAAFNLPAKRACHNFTNPLASIRGDRAEFKANRYGWNHCADFDPPLYELWGRISYGFHRQEQGWVIDHMALEKLRESGNLAVSLLRSE